MFPTTLESYLENVARETAKMSWPDRMSGILKAKTKEAVEVFFTAPQFLADLQLLWESVPHISAMFFDEWHKRQAQTLGKYLKEGGWVKGDYHPVAVACKLLNTFLHQLTKHPTTNALWPYLHLTLDRIALGNLNRWRNDFETLKPISSILQSGNAYTLLYADYMKVQNQVTEFVIEVKQRLPDSQITSRIDLNAVLWA